MSRELERRIRRSLFPDSSKVNNCYTKEEFSYAIFNVIMQKSSVKVMSKDIKVGIPRTTLLKAKFYKTFHLKESSNRAIA